MQATRQITVTQYQVDALPTMKAFDRALGFLAEREQDVLQFATHDLVEALQGLASELNVTLEDYEIPLNEYERGTIRFHVPDSNDMQGLQGVRLWKYLEKHHGETLRGDCRLSGICYDYDLTAPFVSYLANPDHDTTLDDLLESAASNLLRAWREEVGFRLSRDYLTSEATINELWFSEDGRLAD